MLLWLNVIAAKTTGIRSPLYRATDWVATVLMYQIKQASDGEGKEGSGEEPIAEPGGKGSRPGLKDLVIPV